MGKDNKLVQDIESLEETILKVKKAQVQYSKFSQEQVDEIFRAASLAANNMRIPLAKLAVEETGMGIVEDKVIKNHYASEYIYNAYKNTKTCGVIDEDKSYGIKHVAEPIGVVAAVIPTTNPTSTAIFKTLLCLKTRNGIIISPHPRAKNSTIAATKVVLEAAVKAGAPKDIIASKIVSYIRARNNSRGSNILTLYKLVNNKVEALEFIAKPKSKLLNKQLKNIKLKDKVLIAGIIRNGESIIPNGADIIQADDRVIVVTAGQYLDDLDDILV